MVEVLHYEPANKNKTIGFVDIKVPILKPVCLILRKIAHVQSGDRRWFNLASFSRDNPDGTPNYLKFAEFEIQAYNGQLLESLSDKVKQYCDRYGIKELEAMDFSGSMPEIPTSMDELPF